MRVNHSVIVRKRIVVWANMVEISAKVSFNSRIRLWGKGDCGRIINKVDEKGVLRYSKIWAHHLK